MLWYSKAFTRGIFTLINLSSQVFFLLFLAYINNFIGGGKEDRTPDLVIANHSLSQLSYTPKNNKLKGRAFRFSLYYARTQTGSQTKASVTCFVNSLRSLARSLVHQQNFASCGKNNVLRLFLSSSFGSAIPPKNNFLPNKIYNICQ